MKESDLCVIAVVYGVATWFLVMTLQLPPAAQSYPLILLTALYLCNTLFLGKQLYSFYRHRVVLNDFRKLFAGFLPGQFFRRLGRLHYLYGLSELFGLLHLQRSVSAAGPILPEGKTDPRNYQLRLHHDCDLSGFLDVPARTSSPRGLV